MHSMLVRLNLTSTLRRLPGLLVVLVLLTSLGACSMGTQQQETKKTKKSTSSAYSESGDGSYTPPPYSPRKFSGSGGPSGGGGSGGGPNVVKHEVDEDAPLYASQQESTLLGCEQSCTRQATEYAVEMRTSLPHSAALQETCRYHCECSYNQVSNSIPFDDYRRALRGQAADTLGTIQGIIGGCADAAGAYWIDENIVF